MRLMHAIVCFLPVLRHLQLRSMKALLFTAYLGCGTVLCVLPLHIRLGTLSALSAQVSTV